MLWTSPSVTSVGIIPIGPTYILTPTWHVDFKNAARSPTATEIGQPPPAPQRTVLCSGKLVKLLLRGSNKSEEGVMLRFYPHFSTFLTHVTSRAFSFPHHLPHAPSMCLQIMGLILAYIALTCIILFAHVLVWFLMAMPQLLITFL
jgi:hypothetical protein